MKNDPTFDMPSQIVNAVDLTADARAGAAVMGGKTDETASRLLAAQKTKH
jgi:hypothetical protein